MIKRQRTEKSKYKHVSTGDYCTCAAYIAEMMCFKIAEAKGISGLPFKFWNIKPWDWTFKKQLMLANSLVKKYGEKCLIKAIRSDSFKSIFSLSHPWVIDILEKTKKELKKQEEIEKKKPIVSESKPIVPNGELTKRKKTFGKNTTISKLRNKDGQSEKDQ